MYTYTLNLILKVREAWDIHLLGPCVFQDKLSAFDELRAVQTEQNEPLEHRTAEGEINIPHWRVVLKEVSQKNVVCHIPKRHGHDEETTNFSVHPDQALIHPGNGSRMKGSRSGEDEDVSGPHDLCRTASGQEESEKTHRYRSQSDKNHVGRTEIASDKDTNETASSQSAPCDRVQLSSLFLAPAKIVYDKRHGILAKTQQVSIGHEERTD